MSNQQRARIPRITTNLQPHQRVDVPPGLIIAYFGDEIMQWLRERAEQSQGKDK